MLLLLACAHPPDDSGPVVALPRVQPYADGATLRDAEGRTLVLHGMNARVDGLFDVTFDDGRTALEPIPPFGEDDCAFLADELGLNLLRLPVNWSGMEPEDDAWDDAYFERIASVVDACHAHGVYTLLDLHQDAYSKEIGEDGAPLWAIVPAPDELLEGPLDNLEQRRISAAVLAAFHSLYTNESGLWTAYGDMAAELAGRFTESPGVVGIELHNEPVTLGDVGALDDFHAAIAADVRERAPDMALYFEPDAFRNTLDVMAVGDVFPFPNAVYSPHIYTDVFEDGWVDEDEQAVRDSVNAARAEADEHGTPLFVGEFGNDPATDVGQHYTTTCLDAFDAVGASWAYWVYEEWSQGRWGLYDADPDDDEARGALRAPIADILDRPYPAAVAGTLVGFSWDGATLVVNLEPGSTGTHVIAAPQRVWPSTVRATCDGAAVEVTRAGGRASFACAGAVVEVTGE